MIKTFARIALPLAFIATASTSPALMTAPKPVSKAIAKPAAKAGVIPAASWARLVQPTPQGGYLIGNPKAPIRIIEYYSLTCSHCGHFTRENLPELHRNYINTGKANLEIRNFVLNLPDLTLSALMRCAPPPQAVRLYRQIFENQDALIGQLNAIAPDKSAKINSAPPAQRPSLIADFAGFYPWFEARGIPTVRAKACLADPNIVSRFTKFREDAAKAFPEIDGTPAFIVNGALVKGADWAALKAVLEATPVTTTTSATQ